MNCGDFQSESMGLSWINYATTTGQSKITLPHHSFSWQSINKSLELKYPSRLGKHIAVSILNSNHFHISQLNHCFYACWSIQVSNKVEIDLRILSCAMNIQFSSPNLGFSHIATCNSLLLPCQPKETPILMIQVTHAEKIKIKTMPWIKIKCKINQLIILNGLSFPFQSSPLLPKWNGRKDDRIDELLLKFILSKLMHTKN